MSSIVEARISLTASISKVLLDKAILKIDSVKRAENHTLVI